MNIKLRPNFICTHFILLITQLKTNQSLADFTSQLEFALNNISPF